MKDIFTQDVLEALFPAQRSDEFFEALFGDASEGSYDIALRFENYDKSTGKLHFMLDLHERPGCCLACNLTYGLPQVFTRHPVINIKGVVKDIESKLEGGLTCKSWQLGTTVQSSRSLHSVPLIIDTAQG